MERRIKLIRLIDDSVVRVSLRSKKTGLRWAPTYDPGTSCRGIAGDIKSCIRRYKEKVRNGDAAYFDPDHPGKYAAYICLVGDRVSCFVSFEDVQVLDEHYPVNKRTDVIPDDFFYSFRNQ